MRLLVEAQLPEWADLPVQPVPSGGTDYTLETNPELVREGERWLAEALA